MNIYKYSFKIRSNLIEQMLAPIVVLLSFFGLANAEYGCSSFAQLTHTASGCPANQGNPDCSFIQANAAQFCSTVATSWEIINGPACNLRGAGYGCIFASGLYSTTDQFCCPLIVTGAAASVSARPTNTAFVSKTTTSSGTPTYASTLIPTLSPSASPSASPSSSASVTSSASSSNTVSMSSLATASASSLLVVPYNRTNTTNTTNTTTLSISSSSSSSTLSLGGQIGIGISVSLILLCCMCKFCIVPFDRKKEEEKEKEKEKEKERRPSQAQLKERRHSGQHLQIRAPTTPKP